MDAHLRGRAQFQWLPLSHTVARRIAGHDRHSEAGRALELTTRVQALFALALTLVGDLALLQRRSPVAPQGGFQEGSRAQSGPRTPRPTQHRLPLAPGSKDLFSRRSDRELWASREAYCAILRTGGDTMPLGRYAR